MKRVSLTRFSFSLPPMRAMLGLMGVLSLVLLVTAAPAARARLQLLWGDPTREALINGDPVSTMDLAMLIATREKVVQEGFAPSSVYNELAMGRVAATQDKSLDAITVKQQLAQALKDQEQALALSPADPYAWARHTYLLLLNEGAGEKAVRSLNFEMDTAPYEPHLMMARLGTAFSLYGLMDEAMRDRVASQLRVTWKKKPKDVEALAKSSGKSAVLEAALRADPETALWLGGRSLGRP